MERLAQLFSLLGTRCYLWASLMVLDGPPMRKKKLMLLWLQPLLI